MNKKLSTNKIMLSVILSCIPAIIISSLLFGTGILSNIIYSISFAILLEAFCLKLRNKEILNHLQDFSAILTAVLFSMCLPPDFSAIKIFVGLVFAIIISKHLYGGLGHNIFNPAMVGYIVLLVAFPQDFTYWPEPSEDISQILSTSLGFTNKIADDITQATPLDPVITAKNLSNNWAYLHAFYLINLSWLLGGIYLIYKKLIPFILPLCFLLGIFTASLLSFTIANNDSYSILYNPIQHLFLGASMMGAFFIITDPVTASVSKYGKMIYGLIAGMLCYLIREFGGYPDGVGFAVLFMNTWVPLLNKITLNKN